MIKTDFIANLNAYYGAYRKECIPMMLDYLSKLEVEYIERLFRKVILYYSGYKPPMIADFEKYRDDITNEICTGSNIDESRFFYGEQFGLKKSIDTSKQLEYDLNMLIDRFKENETSANMKAVQDARKKLEDNINLKADRVALV